MPSQPDLFGAAARAQRDTGNKRAQKTSTQQRVRILPMLDCIAAHQTSHDCRKVWILADGTKHTKTALTHIGFIANGEDAKCPSIFGNIYFFPLLCRCSSLRLSRQSVWRTCTCRFWHCCSCCVYCSKDAIHKCKWLLVVTNPLMKIAQQLNIWFEHSSLKNVLDSERLLRSADKLRFIITKHSCLGIICHTHAVFAIAG